MDDSLGEAFDKTARLLGLPVGGGGGPAVEALAREGDPKAVLLSVPLQYRKDLDFSYAGLKSAVRRLAEKYMVDHNVSSTTELPRQVKADIAASFQNVAIRHVEQRLRYAMDQMEDQYNITTLAVVGGVAANTELRTRLEALCTQRGEVKNARGNSTATDKQKRPWNLFVPPPRLCTDQGAMSAWAAIERILVGSTDDPHDQEVHARYPFAKQ
jgi:N6-L-threonylcarbamoyladenine synthase